MISYSKGVFISLMLFVLLLILVISFFSFDPKSAFALFLFGVIGFLVKSLLFHLPYKLISIKNKDTSVVLFLKSLIPFFLFVLWFLTIIVFNIEVLFFDIGYGYINRCPHFILQLLAVLISSLITLFDLLKENNP